MADGHDHSHDQQKEEKKEEKKRKNNWGDKEVELLVDLCSSSKMPEAKFDQKVTARAKYDFWHKTLDQINSEYANGRTLDEVKKKWTDVKVSISVYNVHNQEEGHGKGQGGFGPAPPPLKEWEQKVLSKLPSSVTKGIQDGTDIFQENLNNQPHASTSSEENDSDSQPPPQQHPTVIQHPSQPSLQNIAEDLGPSQTISIVNANDQLEPSSDSNQPLTSTSKTGTSDNDTSNNIRSKKKRNNDEELVNLQIKYFENQIAKQPLELEILKVKLAVLKKAEKKIDELGPFEILKVISDDIFVTTEP